jgi:hypothetical protein
LQEYLDAANKAICKMPVSDQISLEALLAMTHMLQLQ